MIGVSNAPRRVFGVSFADPGARPAGAWVCRAHPGADGVRVESIEAFADLPGGTTDPTAVYRAVLGKIAEAPRSAWGLEVPLGLSIVGRRRTEAERGLDAAVQSAADRRFAEALRAMPSTVLLPFDDVPFLAEGMPVEMIRRAPSTYVLEVSAAALRAQLVRDGVLVDTGPLSTGPALRALAAANIVRPMARALRTRVIEQPEAFAALLSAVAAWRGCRGHDHGTLGRQEVFAAEGYIYC